MRVLHINAGNMYGGVETLLVTLARCRHLCPQMEPSFAVCFEGRLSEELAAAGVPVHQLGEVKASRFWTVMRARRVLRHLLFESGAEVVVTHMPWAHAIFGPEVRRARLPLVNWVHGVADRRHWSERWAGRTPPDVAVCNTQFTATQLLDLFLESRKEVLYYPVMAAGDRVSYRSCIRRRLGIEDDTVVILQASRMEAWKGHELHLEALATIKSLPNWICWFAGGAQRREEREYMMRLRSRCANLGISDRVRFLGQRSDVSELMCAADIFCQPNRDPEPFGIVFIEALWAGLPVVSTCMGGVQEIVDSSCGVLVRPWDRAQLAEALRTLILDDARRMRLGSLGPERAAALCSPARQIPALADILLRLPARAGAEYC